MFWHFICKIFGRKSVKPVKPLKPVKLDLPEATGLDDQALTGYSSPAPPTPADLGGSPKEPDLRAAATAKAGSAVPNPADTAEAAAPKTPAIPAWASSWLESTDTKEIKKENTKPAAAENPENLSGNQSAEPAANSAEFKSGELKTEALAEPLNVEVKEMVLRQIHNSRSTARYMCSTEDLVEEKIRKAMEKGEFDNLEGQGKPIRFEENPYEDPDLRLAFKILKDAGFAPYWIEMGKQIDAEIAGCQMIFDRFLETLKYRQKRLGNLHRTPELDERVQQVLEACSDKLEEANRKIDSYNLVAPIVWVQRRRVDVPAEMAKLELKLKEILRF